MFDPGFLCSISVTAEQRVHSCSHDDLCAPCERHVLGIHGAGAGYSKGQSIGTHEDCTSGNDAMLTLPVSSGADVAPGASVGSYTGWAGPEGLGKGFPNGFVGDNQIGKKNWEAI